MTYHLIKSKVGSRSSGKTHTRTGLLSERGGDRMRMQQLSLCEFHGEMSTQSSHNGHSFVGAYPCGRKSIYAVFMILFCKSFVWKIITQKFARYACSLISSVNAIMVY